jgi:predicted secreted Zn-dependent protease
MHGFVWLGLGGLALVLACEAVADPLVRQHTSYYYVHGNSATVLAAQLDQNGPVDADGKRYPGKTRWDVQWKFNTDQAGETCSLKDVMVAVGIAQTLPRWGGEDKGPATLKARWQKFAAALKRHEDGHLEFGRKAGAEIEQLLLAAKPGSNCEDLSRSVSAAADKVVEKYRRQDREYDKATDHGRRDGATLL